MSIEELYRYVPVSNYWNKFVRIAEINKRSGVEAEDLLQEFMLFFLERNRKYNITQEEIQNAYSSIRHRYSTINSSKTIKKQFRHGNIISNATDLDDPMTGEEMQIESLSGRVPFFYYEDELHRAETRRYRNKKKAQKND